MNLKNDFLTQLHRERLRTQHPEESAKDKRDTKHTYMTVYPGHLQSITYSMTKEECSFL